MKKRHGSSLLMIMSLATLLLLSALAASINAVSDTGLSNDEKIKTRLEFACKAGLNRAKSKIDQSFNNSTLTLLQPNVEFQGTTADDTGLTPAAKAIQDETFTKGTGTEPDFYTFTYHSTIDNRDIKVKYAITQSKNWQISESYATYSMNIQAIAYSSGYGWVGMSQNAAARRTTLFMYQVFYQNDLEILPGPNFNLKGLIHTNGNLYLNANSGSTLSINTDSLTSAGNAIRGRLDVPGSESGTVSISTGNSSGALVSMNAGQDSTNANWKNIAAQDWSGTLKDSALGATTLAAPQLASFQPGGYYQQNAGLAISVLAKGKTLANTQYKITYNGSTTTYTSSALGGALTDADIYDQREYGTSRQVQVTEVDITKLASKIGYPTNGIVYMTRDDAVPDQDGNPYTADPNRNVSGFKLFDGSDLPASTTFVSNLPTYIQGDFNLHTNSNPDTDTWKPCAVIADAIDLLSNSWVDSKSNTEQTASNTTYNTVFITGNVPTKTGQYSGGLENFPRFLENWTSKNSNITGGFIQLFRSNYATGIWGSSYYQAPTRSWQSESRFSDLTQLPPTYANLFPSTNLGTVYSGWTQISKSGATLIND